MYMNVNTSVCTVFSSFFTTYFGKQFWRNASFLLNLEMMQKEEVDGSTKMHHNDAIHAKIDTRLNPYTNKFIGKHKCDTTDDEN